VEWKGRRGVFWKRDRSVASAWSGFARTQPHFHPFPLFSNPFFRLFYVLPLPFSSTPLLVSFCTIARQNDYQTQNSFIQTCTSSTHLPILWKECILLQKLQVLPLYKASVFGCNTMFKAVVKWFWILSRSVKFWTVSPTCNACLC